MAKRPFTVWVPFEVFTVLQAQAAAEGKDLSPFTARLLARALADGVGGSPRLSLVVETLQEAFTVETKAELNAVAEAASKAALYAMAGRLELGSLLVKKFGEVQARRVQQEAWRKAVEGLRQPLMGEG